MVWTVNKKKNKQNQPEPKKEWLAVKVLIEASMVHHPTPVGGVLSGVGVMMVSCGVSTPLQCRDRPQPAAGAGP